MSKFELPKLHWNSNGWGPSPDFKPDEFRDIPFTPYSKSDKIGKIADWTNPEGQKQDNREVTGRQGRTGFNRSTREQPQAYGAAFAPTLLTSSVTDEESSFSVVDSRAALAKKVKPAGGARGRPQNKQQQPLQQQQQQQQHNSRGKQQPGRRRYGNDQPLRVASVAVKSNWQLLDEIEFPRLNKLSFQPRDVENAENVATFGTVNYYNKDYDRITANHGKPLKSSIHAKYVRTTSDDPIIRQFEEENRATVFATDSILSLLMCSTRTVYPWDIEIKKSGGKVFFDKRRDDPLDLITVNENAHTPPVESEKKDINSSGSLGDEAMNINRHFARQVVDENKSYKFEKPNPFASEATKEHLAPCGYRYRKFDLTNAADDSAEPVHLIVRTEVDAAVKIGANTLFTTVHALNQFDTEAQGAGNQLPWKRSLDSQRGAVVATEIKNNAAKLARWVVEAMLAGADFMRLGYVARSSPRDNKRHEILGVQSFKPVDLARQMTLNVSTGWGIVKAVVDMCLKLPDGTYYLMKDPNRPILQFYSVPANDGAGSEEEEEEEKEDDAASNK